MLNALNMRANTPSFCKIQKVLIADDDSLTNSTNALILPKRVECPKGDTLEISRADSFEDAEKALDSNEKFDIVVTDGHYNSSKDYFAGSGRGDGLIIAQKATDKFGKDKVVLFSSDDTLKPSAKKIGVHFVPKDYPQLYGLITNIMKTNENSGLNVNA